MEIRVFLVCILFNFVIRSSETKTFSLNEALAAEERNKLPRKSGSTSTADRFKSLDFHRQNLRDISKSLSTSLLSPLKLRRPFQIKSLSPKTLKGPQKGLRSVNQTKQSKRQSYDEDINKNYVPLFKSLSVILDNILEPDSGEAVQKKQYKRKKSRFESNDVVCSCALRSTTESDLSDSYQEAVAAATLISTEIETESPPFALTTTKTHRSATNNIGNIKRNQDVPVLFTRNTLGLGRNNNGIDERHSSSHIRNNEGFDTRNYRYHELDTGIRNILSNTENSEDNTHSDTRNNASSSEPNVIRPNRDRDGTVSRKSDRKENTIKEIHTPINIEGLHLGHKEKNILSNRTVQTESAIPVSKLTPRLQRVEPYKSEVIQPKFEKDYAAIKHFITSAKQIFNRNFQNSTNNKGNSRTNETVVGSKKGHNKGIMIFDGYSVARDVNGENKLTERALEIKT